MLELSISETILLAIAVVVFLVMILIPRKEETINREEKYICEESRKARLQELWSLFSSENDHRKSLEYLNEILELDPENASAYNGRGVMNSVLLNHREAVVDYDRAIALNPKDSLPYSHRAVSRFALGDIDGMEADFKKAITLNPDDPVIYKNRAAMLRQMAKRENAFMAKILIERAEKDEMISESKLP